MKYLVVLVLFNVFLDIAVCGNYDWFFDDDFGDGIVNDDDDIKQFWRRTRRPYTKKSETIKTTTELEYDLHDERSSSGSEEETATEEPTTEKTTTERTTTERTTTEKTTTEKTTTESLTSQELTSEETVTEDNAPVGPSYYEIRKQKAVRCKGIQSIMIEDEFACQQCTCNGAGVMLCTIVKCGSQINHGIEKQHIQEMKSAENSNLIMREYATGCVRGTMVKANKCTCKCVMESVLSCPRKCFYSEDDPAPVVTDDNKPKKDPTTHKPINEDDADKRDPNVDQNKTLHDPEDGKNKPMVDKDNLKDKYDSPELMEDENNNLRRYLMHNRHKRKLEDEDHPNYNKNVVATSRERQSARKHGRRSDRNL